ncbi:glycosyltransferase family 2 protein [Leclercia pneumoniae]|uniref:glycosyltransferase family 2 protein n=1 Tax=Leclercia pneumoniae TaxID=2815358 RepID=UPI003AF6FB0C
MSNKMISIVTINYNNSLGLKKTIESINAQTCDDFEYIIIDGNSTDDSVAIGNGCPKCDIFVTEKDDGIYDAMNKGAELASGEYILFLNSGDTLRDNSVKVFIDVLLATHCSYDIYHGILAFEKEGVILNYRGRTEHLLRSGMIEHPTVLMRKKKFDSLYGFDLKWKYVADYDLIIRAKREESTFYFIETVLSNFDVSGVSSTSIKAPIESLKLQKHHKLISNLEYLARLYFMKLKGLLLWLK